MALTENMTLQQLLAYAQGGVRAAPSVCPTATAKYRQALSMATTGVAMPEYAQFATKLQVLNLLLDADKACDVAKAAAKTSTAAAAASSTQTRQPLTAGVSAGMPWWAWGAIALGGIWLLKGAKKGTQRKRRRKTTRRRRRR